MWRMLFKVGTDFFDFDLLGLERSAVDQLASDLQKTVDLALCLQPIYRDQ